MDCGLRTTDYGLRTDRSQKPLSMRTHFPPSNVSKWRTTNGISPRTWASHKAAHTIIQTLIIGWITPLTCLVCLCIVFSEIGGHFLQDILTYLASFCANVRYWWDRNWARIFSFVKTAQCLLSLRFGLRYRCFFREEISKMTFFSLPWSWENASQRQCMVVNRKEQLMKLYENLSARPRSSRCKMRLSKPVCK